jgi:hypothetical protein
VKRLLLLLLVIAAAWLHAASADESNASKLWISSLFVGAQFLPDYDVNNTSKGLENVRLYADVNLDARWKYLSGSGESNGIINLGLDVKLLGTPVSREEGNATNLSKTTFDDVSDTVDAAVYGGYVPEFLRFGKESDFASELGLEMRGGIISREKKSAEQSILDEYIGAGVKYAFFRKDPYSADGVAQRIPDGYFTYQYRYYSEYARKDAAWRHILEFRYKIASGMEWYLGTHANLSDSNEELYLTLSVRNNVEDILKLLGVTNK